MNKASTFILASLIASCLSGCGVVFFSDPPWYADIRKNGSTVQFCISNETTCPLPETRLTGIAVYGWNDLRRDYSNLMWEAVPHTAQDQIGVGYITYGVPPKNWYNQFEPAPLICGNAYRVEYILYFIMNCDGTLNVIEPSDFRRMPKDFHGRIITKR